MPPPDHPGPPPKFHSKRDIFRIPRMCLIRMRSRRFVLGPHRIGNLRIRADTGGHDRYEGIPGHGTFSPTTSAAGTMWRRVRIPPGGGRVCTLTNEAGVILNEPRDRLSRSAYAGAGPFAVLTLWADGGVDLPIVEAPNWGVSDGPSTTSFLSGDLRRARADACSRARSASRP